MDMTRGLSWLSSLASRKVGPAAGHEPADMGTAFGLDASFADEGEPVYLGVNGVATDVALQDRLNRRSVI